MLVNSENITSIYLAGEGLLNAAADAPSGTKKNKSK